MSALLFILYVLKIIGIIILSIIFLILLILLIILFVPIKYVVYAENKNNVKIDLKVSWLLNLFKYVFKYKDGKKYSFIKIIKNKKPKNKKTKNEKKKNSEKLRKTEKKVKKHKKTNTQQTSKIYKKISEKEIKKPKKQEKNKEHINKIEQNTNNMEQNENTAQKKEKAFIISKIKKIKEFPNKEILLNKIIIYLKKLFKHVLPRDYKLEAIIGMEDPAVTGYILAGVGIILPYVDKNCKINVSGNFNNKVFIGEFYAKGKIFLGYIVMITAKLLIDKNIRVIIKYIRKKQSENL